MQEERVASVLSSPQRCVLEFEGVELHFNPFGNISAHNVLRGFDGTEPVEDDGTGLNVKSLFLYNMEKALID